MFSNQWQWRRIILFIVAFLNSTGYLVANEYYCNVRIVLLMPIISYPHMLLSNTTTPFITLRQERFQRKDSILNTNIIITVDLTKFDIYTNEPWLFNTINNIANHE